VAALLVLAGCSSTHTSRPTSSTLPAVDLRRVVLRSTDVPGWRQTAPPGLATPSQRSKDGAVASCIGVDTRLRQQPQEGSTLVLIRPTDLEEIQSSAGQYRSAAAPLGIATSARWPLCSAKSVQAQIATAGSARLIGTVHATVGRVDKAHGIATMRITYTLALGLVRRSYYEDTAMVWHDDVAAFVYVDRTGRPPSAALEDRLIALIVGRL
jgi:hypothetical protein